MIPAETLNRVFRRLLAEDHPNRNFLVGFFSHIASLVDLRSLRAFHTLCQVTPKSQHAGTIQMNP